MTEKVDARGMACPQPVILAKKALEGNRSVYVLVDNRVAMENIKRLAKRAACSAKIRELEQGVFEIHLVKDDMKNRSAASKEEPVIHTLPTVQAGPLVVAVSDSRMGRGDDELGSVLMRSFMHALLEIDPLPDIMIFYNAGAKLTVRDSDIIEDLRQLQEKGVEILVCGTCANYFGIHDRIGVGKISNMYDIAGIMAGARQVIRP
jgi:selenium metabolism protein YedF